MHNATPIKSVVSSGLTKYMLFKGFGFALVGICLLVFGGMYLSPKILGIWGSIIYLAGIGLMAGGMLPYKRLERLRFHPDELVIRNADLEYYSAGVKKLTIPLRSIEKIAYRDESLSYGIFFYLKRSIASPVIVYGNLEDTQRMRTIGRKAAGADLFIPLFNRRAFDRLSVDLESEKEV